MIKTVFKVDYSENKNLGKSRGRNLVGCLLLLTLMTLSSLSFGVTKTWVGGSGNWNTAANWSPSGAPSSDDDIIISSGAPSTGALTINSNGSLTISNAATFSVSGNITMNGDGQIIINGGTLLHTGNQFNFPYSAIANVIINSGTLSTTASNFKVNSRMEMNGGRFLAKAGLAIQSGKSFIATAGFIQVDGELDIQSSGSTFRAGRDSLIINGNLSVESGCFFYGDSSVVIVNGMGNGNVKNNIFGTFYTNAAHVSFNPTATTDVGSGGKFYGNTGTVAFNDRASIGNNGQLYVDSSTMTFTEDLTVSQSGSIDAGSGDLTFEGDASFQNSGTLNAGSATINFEGNASFTQSGTLNANTSTLNFDGNATFSNSGTLNAGSAEVNFGGDVIISNNGGTINAQSSTMTISGDINNAGTFNAGTSTVILNGDSSQTIASDITFYNLTIETNGTVQAGGNVTVLNGGTIGSNSQIAITDANDQFNVQGDLVDSSGTLAVNTNKPFVTNILVNNSTEIVVVFNETVTVASSENAANSTWTGRTISNRSRIDTNKLRIQFTPAISQDVEYTLTFQNIQNNRSPVGTMSAGHTKKFTWEAPSVPSTASSALNFTSVATTSYTLNWTSGNGTRRIVIARSGSAVNFTPSNGTEYTANASFGAGTNLGTGNYVVYQGTGSSVSLTNLSAATTYYFAIYEYNGSGATTVYQSISPLTGSQITAYLTPSVQTSGFAVSGSSDTSITLMWINGNGSKRIVLARSSSAVNSFPVNNTTYTPNTAFGSGTQLGSGNYVVYAGTGSSVTITGLENNRKYFFTVLEFNGTNGLEKYLTTASPTLSTNTCIRVDIKIFMEGPFNGSNMNAALIDNIPDTQVYNTAPWNYSGSEAVNGMPNANVVDWVLVEMREAPQVGFASDTSIVGRRAGLLLSNGKIVDLDGVSPLLIQTNRSGRMYAVVYHRTHLPVQSNDSLQRGSNKHVYDFTTAGNTAFGSSSPLLQVSTGVYAMYCGRVANNTSDTIGTFDAIEAWNERNLAGYYAADVNLDGIVDASDRSFIWNNNGTSTQIVD